MGLVSALLIGLLAAPPEYAALTEPPQALQMRGDTLMVATASGLAWFQLDRGQLRDAPPGPAGEAPDMQAFRASARRTTYAIGGNTWALSTRGVLRRNGKIIARDLRADRVLGLGRLGLLVMATGAAATGVGDLIRFDIDGNEVWRSGPAPRPTAAAFDRQRQAAWIGTESGAIDRWRLADGTRIRAIPSGRSEPIVCVARMGDRLLVADAHRGLWLWIGRHMVLHRRLDADITGLHLAPEIGAYLRAPTAHLHWRMPDGVPPTVEITDAPIDCAPRDLYEADDSLGLDGVRYVMRADGHWRSERDGDVVQGRVPGRADR